MTKLVTCLYNIFFFFFSPRLVPFLLPDPFWVPPPFIILFCIEKFCLKSPADFKRVDHPLFRALITYRSLQWLFPSLPMNGKHDPGRRAPPPRLISPPSVIVFPLTFDRPLISSSPPQIPMLPNSHPRSSVDTFPKPSVLHIVLADPSVGKTA